MAAKKMKGNVCPHCGAKMLPKKEGFYWYKDSYGNWDIGFWVDEELRTFDNGTLESADLRDRDIEIGEFLGKEPKEPKKN